MARNYDDQSLLREYLLSHLTGEAQELIEQRLMTDDELFDQLQAAEDELIDQYILGALSNDEVEMFERHFLVTPQRKQKLRFAKALRRYVAAQPTDQSAKTSERPQKITEPPQSSWSWPRFISASPLRAAAFAVLILVAGLGVWRIFFYQSDVDKGLLALNSAYRNQRPVEARITRLDYAPFVTTRGSEPVVNSQEREYAQRYLLDAARDHPGATSYHALGKYYLANREFDNAIQWLDKALKADADNPQVYADLGAAHLEKGKLALENAESDKTDSEAGKGLESLARSLEHLNKALVLKPNLLEALFNRALCYQNMGLPHQAEADWREYLRTDPSSPWAEEARQKLKLLEEGRSNTSQNKDEVLKRFLDAHQTKDDDQAWAIIGQNHSPAGNLITNLLIDSYIDLKRDGRVNEANDKLEILQYAGELTRRRTNDRYVSDVAHFYGLATVERRTALAQAREAMEKGYHLFIKSRFNDAIISYSEAKRLFEQVGDQAEALFAEYRIGHCYVLQPNLDRSSRIFEKLLSTSQTMQYQWLLAQCLYGSAHIKIALSEYSRAIEFSNHALELSEQLTDTNGVVKCLIQLAEEYRSLNNKNKSLNFIFRTLNSIGAGFLDPLQAWGSYIAISLNFNSFGLQVAALEYQKEALSLALGMARPLVISRTYVYLGLTYGNLKNYEEALSNIHLAIQTGRNITDEPNGLEIVANASVQLGEIYRQMGDHAQAVAAYDQSLTLYDELSFQYFAFAAHKGKLLSFLAQQDDASAAQEIQIVLDMFQQFRSKITGQSQRNTFFDAEQSIYDLAIDFEYSKRSNPQRAFEYSESSRARSLRDILRRSGEIVGPESGTEFSHSGASMAPTLLEIQRDLPPKTQILEYSLLSDKLLIWVVTDKKLLPVAVPISEGALTQKVQNYLSSLQLQHSSGTNMEVSQAGKELYDILVKPVEAILDKTYLLCIVPDKILNYLPYAALISSTSGRYLIEDYRLQLAPSAGIFLDCSKIANDLSGIKEEKLLSVGNPTFDKKILPELPDLPAAAREAAVIARNYPSHTVLLGSSATARQIKSEIARSDVAHFAVHYVVDRRSEMLSELVLAKEPVSGTKSETSLGILRAYDIYQMKLPQTRLVVLSGCQTGVEQQYRGEGAVGLAYPFLGARVPLVVASLWAVDSESTAELMIDFHQARRVQRLPTAEALRQAQLHMLHGANERYRQPFYWASFVTIGGRADF